jgi:predicted RNase H-like nuclease (RuvC/YqgF family)
MIYRKDNVVTEDIRHRQERIEFLEDYIDELTEKIDELTGGRDYEKDIRSLEYRIEVLKQCEEHSACFADRVMNLEKELDHLKTEYNEMKPTLEELEIERAYYRSFQSDL